VQPAPPRPTTLVVRRIGPLSALRIAFFFWAWVALMGLLAVTLIWIGVTASGSVDRFEAFLQDLGFDDFRVQTGALWRVSATVAVVFALTATIATWILTVAFNLLASMVGGVRLEVTAENERRR
jgi:hypothetical protein